MSLKTIVKVSHISNLSDARYCAGMGVDMLGVGVVPSAANYMAPGLFQDIRGWIAGPKVIAELYGASKEEVLAGVETYRPDLVELTLTEYEKFASFLTLPCMVRLDGAIPRNGLPHSEKILYFIADEKMRCGDIAGDVSLLVQVTSVRSLNEKLAERCFSGVVLEGPRQSRPGVTNYDQLGELLEALEE